MDWLGSLLVTASLMRASYAIVEATTHGWISREVLAVGALAGVLMAAFLALEATIQNPIMPLHILRLTSARPETAAHRGIRALRSSGCRPLWRRHGRVARILWESLGPHEAGALDRNDGDVVALGAGLEPR